MVYIWLCIILLLIVVEIMTSNLIAFYFILSGLVSLILSLVLNIYYLQVSMFLILGLFLLIKTRTKLQEKLDDKNIFRAIKDKIFKKGKIK